MKQSELIALAVPRVFALAHVPPFVKEAAAAAMQGEALAALKARKLGEIPGRKPEGARAFDAESFDQKILGFLRDGPLHMSVLVARLPPSRDDIHRAMMRLTSRGWIVRHRSGRGSMIEITELGRAQ